MFKTPEVLAISGLSEPTLRRWITKENRIPSLKKHWPYANKNYDKDEVFLITVIARLVKKHSVDLDFATRILLDLFAFLLRDREAVLQMSLVVQTDDEGNNEFTYQRITDAGAQRLVESLLEGQGFTLRVLNLGKVMEEVERCLVPV